jgi:cytochrome c551
MRKFLTLAGWAWCLAVVCVPTQAADSARAVQAPVPEAQPLNAAGEGRRQYLKLNCYGCHGTAAAGGMGPRIVRRDLSEVSAALLNGRPGGMRSFAAYVTQRDINNITAYLQSIGTPDEPTFNDWWFPIPPK